jgi:ankyrin repeat protein
MVADVLVESIPHWLYVGDTPLHLAAASLRLWAAQLVLRYEADPNATNRRGATPLHYACDPRPNSGGTWDPPAQVALITQLLESGADVNAVDRGGITPLHRAVRARSPAAVRELLRHGAQVDARSGRGSTPLQLAGHTTGAGGTAGTAAEQREILDLLVQHGARAAEKPEPRPRS